MKSILLSIKPEWLAKILNGEKTIEVRKKFPKNYVGWVYLYCSKNGGDLFFDVWNEKAGEKPLYLIANKHEETQWLKKLNGKVVARFWCDKVDEIICRPICGEWECYTKDLGYSEIAQASCLANKDIVHYLKGKNGCAIHISKLEIFDRPRELSEFKHYNKPNCESCQFQYSAWCDYHKEVGCDDIPLTKAPQSFMYVGID